MLSDFMSMVRADSVGLPRPRVRNHTHLSEPTAGQRAFMAERAVRELTVRPVSLTPLLEQLHGRAGLPARAGRAGRRFGAAFTAWLSASRVPAR